MTGDLTIAGPYGWPGSERSQIVLPPVPGVYVTTFEYCDGYLPYGVGITRRPMRRRFLEHTRKYLAGDYNILDVADAQRAVRTVLWKGWGWTSEKREEFRAREREIAAMAEQQFLATRIFIIEIVADTVPRLPERIEAAVARHYYESDDTLFDRGMLLMPRWNQEEPVVVSLRCNARLYGLPSELEI